MVTERQYHTGLPLLPSNAAQRYGIKLLATAGVWRDPT
jgi:hypothetical protein